MSNQNFSLQTEAIDISAKKQAEKGQTLGATVKKSNSYLPTEPKFRFTVSEKIIDFGKLTPGTPVTRTNTLSISNKYAPEYTVFASQESPAVIPDTTCDNGLCTQTYSSEWISPLTYGFGYRCDNALGEDCAYGFSNANLFKQFSDSNKNEPAQAVLHGRKNEKTVGGKITYKVNIANLQPAQFYTNHITYIAIPSY